MLYHPRRCSTLVGIATKKYLVLSGGFLCPATKLLLPQTPCVTDASPTINYKTPTQSRLASVLEQNCDAAHDDTVNRSASTAAIERPPQLTRPRRATREGEPLWPYPTRSPPQKIERTKYLFQPSNRYWGVGKTPRAPSRTSIRRQRLVSPTTTRTPSTQILRS